MRNFALMLLAMTLPAQRPSNELNLSWLVREDLFAGLLDNDKARMAKGLETLNAVAAMYPEIEVLGWKYSAEVNEAV